MAQIKVEIKSKEIIKPATKTPNHLKTLKLSLTDQFAPPIFIHVLFFYQTPVGLVKEYDKELLKNSLSQTLDEFYPLAGRLEDKLTINCNDQGVEFYEANVSASLFEVMAVLDPQGLKRLVANTALDDTNKNGIVAAVQLNCFSCGGIAVALSISHKIADGGTIGTFATTWARNNNTIARGLVPPNKIMEEVGIFDSSASQFPPVDLDLDLNHAYDSGGKIVKENIVTRRLIFDKQKLDALKKQCDSIVSRPSRSEIVSAFLWKKFIKIARAKPTPPKIFIAAQMVNLRTIHKSPIPMNRYGNLFFYSFAQHEENEPEITQSEAVSRMRTAVSEIDTSYIEKIETGECLVDMAKVYESIIQGEAEACGFSSCVRFPVYDADYGWGKPIWVSLTALPFRNSVFLMSTKCGQGVEAWVNVPEHDVVVLEEDEEVRSLANSRSIVRANL